MKTLERSSDLIAMQPSIHTKEAGNSFAQPAAGQNALTAKNVAAYSTKKVAPTMSDLPLNGLSEVTYVTGFGDAAVLPCHTADPDLFFSESTSEINQAKALCGNCPVARQCLEGALSRSEPCGVWGGQLLDNGRVVAAKRRAGRPRIHIQDESQRIVATATPAKFATAADEAPRPAQVESSQLLEQLERAS